MTPKCCSLKPRIFILRFTLRSLAVTEVVGIEEGGEVREIWGVDPGFEPSAGTWNQAREELGGVEGAPLIVCWRKVTEGLSQRASQTGRLEGCLDPKRMTNSWLMKSLTGLTLEWWRISLELTTAPSLGFISCPEESLHHPPSMIWVGTISVGLNHRDRSGNILKTHILNLFHLII